jgi:hypothetical protein
VSFAGLNKFISDTSHDPISMWRTNELLALAGRTPPDDFIRRHGSVLRADTHALWLRWFVQGLCNPLRYVEDEKKTVVDVYNDTFSRVNQLYPNEIDAEKKDLAKGIAEHVIAEVERLRKLKRTNASTSKKRELVDASDGKPRCWMCGYLFSPEAINKFLKPGESALKLPELVDIFRPRGLYLRDVSIEIEHIVPVAAGGGGMENLALACGWCNKSKGEKTSVYDADSRPPRATYSLGSNKWYELPHPFWTVRLLAMRQVCEHTNCSANIRNAELFIAPSDSRGSLNPTNLHVYCAQHDPFSAYRFYGREKVRTIWASRKS